MTDLNLSKEYLRGASTALHAVARYLNSRADEFNVSANESFAFGDAVAAMSSQKAEWALRDAATYLLSPGMKI